MNILISKNNPKPSKFQNLNFGEITNQTINRNQNKPQGWVRRRCLRTMPRWLQQQGGALLVREEEALVLFLQVRASDLIRAA